MINWEIEISNYAPDSFKTDKYLKSVKKIATPIMEYFCFRLNEIEELKIEDAIKIFTNIIEDIPIMIPVYHNGEFSIKYNRWVSINLTDTTKQIYRDIKIEKILK